MSQPYSPSDVIAALGGSENVPEARDGLIIDPSLATRLVRAITGDPIDDRSVTSTGATDVHNLPRIDRALSCVAYVSGADIIVRLAGGSPLAPWGHVVSQGTLITLTGQPSMLGFSFVSVGAVPATLFVTYYT